MDVALSRSGAWLLRAFFALIVVFLYAPIVVLLIFSFNDSAVPTFPLSLSGVFAAFLFVFIPTLGEFVTPSLVGGTDGYMYGNQIADLFGTGFPDWRTGSVLALFLLGVVGALTLVFARFLQPRQVAAD